LDVCRTRLTVEKSPTGILQQVIDLNSRRGFLHFADVCFDMLTLDFWQRVSSQFEADACAYPVSVVCFLITSALLCRMLFTTVLLGSPVWESSLSYVDIAASIWCTRHLLALAAIPLL